MPKTYKGSLTLDWYNKQKAILVENDRQPNTVSAASINWINKDDSLFYEVVDSEGRGLKPFWVDKNDIRVKEARPLILQGVYKATKVNSTTGLTGLLTEFSTEVSKKDDPTVENILVRGDNLLALNTLKKLLLNKREEERVKVAYLDVPYNTESAFEDYDDNLEHSEWLTLIRDRLTLVHSILREDGCVFVHLDDKEAAYCKVLLDEIFGRANYCNQIVMSTNEAFGFKSTSNDLFKQANHILLYAKNKAELELKRLYSEKEYDKNYKFIFIDKTLPETDWKWEGINDAFARAQGFSSAREAKAKLAESEYEAQLALFAVQNADRVFRTASVSGGALLKRKDTIALSKTKKNEIVRHPNDDMDYQFIGGERVLGYHERLIMIDGDKLPGQLVTDIWTDISIEGIAREGGVDFAKSKKPEKLVERVIALASEPGDLVLDIFGGSGTTFAVAHKMGRKWLGVEVGKHAETKILPRLTAVLDGTDQSGISKSMGWQGGGSFKYYHLGPSIITFKENGDPDFNWQLGKSFIEESFLSSYDYTLVTETDFLGISLFPNSDTTPKIGVQKINGKVRVAVVSLNSPDGPQPTISYDELRALYAAIKRQFAPQYINVFTNRGIELAYDSKPEDLEVIKIPHAIFAELEK